MSVIVWLLWVWFIIDLLLCIVGILAIVIGGRGREREHRIMYGEVTRQVIGEVRRLGMRRAKAVEQVHHEDEMAAYREDRERARW
jgi:hypothetical protein